MPHARQNRRAKGKSGALQEQPVTHLSAHPVPDAVSIAALRAALAVDAKCNDSKDPLDDCMVGYLGKLTQCVLRQDTPERTQLTEALGPILLSSGWEEGRVERACDTIWEASQKAAVSHGTRIELLESRKAQATAAKNAMEALAEFHARELSAEEEKAEARRQRKLRSKEKRRLLATEVKGSAESSDVGADVSGLEEDAAGAPATNAVIDGQDMGWIVTRYDAGQETTWTLNESEGGTVTGLRIVERNEMSPKPKLLQASSGVPLASPSLPDNNSCTSLGVSNDTSQTPFAQKHLAGSAIPLATSDSLSFRLDDDSAEDAREREDLLKTLDEESAQDSSDEDLEPENDSKDNVSTLETEHVAAVDSSCTTPTTNLASSSQGTSQTSPAGPAPAPTNLPFSCLRPPRPDADLAPGYKASRAPGTQRPISRSNPSSSAFPGGHPPFVINPPNFPQAGDGCWNPLTHGTDSDRSGSHSQPSSPGLFHDSSPSLFARQLSPESFSSASPVIPGITPNPSVLWPSTPDMSPWCDFRLPPGEFSLSTSALPAPEFCLTGAQGEDASLHNPDASTTSNAPNIVYVPVYITMPHRCSHCGHECTGASPSEVAAAQPCIPPEAPFSGLCHEVCLSVVEDPPLALAPALP